MTAPLLDIDRMEDRLLEMAELRDAVDEAGRAGGGCVLLSGAPGVGKSTLTQAFGFELTGRNCVFAYGDAGTALRRHTLHWVRRSARSSA